MTRESVGEVNCRKLRGSVRGPAPAILWGRERGSRSCVCRSEKGRRPVNQLRAEERNMAPNEDVGANERDEREKREQGVREKNRERQHGR